MAPGALFVDQFVDDLDSVAVGDDSQIDVVLFFERRGNGSAKESVPRLFAGPHGERNIGPACTSHYVLPILRSQVARS